MITTVLGVVIFAVGMWVNIHSDNILQAAKEKLSKEVRDCFIVGSKRYVRIDTFLFKYISNPNYL